MVGICIAGEEEKYTDLVLKLGFHKETSPWSRVAGLLFSRNPRDGAAGQYN
jgi:hypothetical protein